MKQIRWSGVAGGLVGLLVMSLALQAQGQSEVNHGQGQPDGRGDTTRQNPRNTSGGAVVTGNGINYNGGQVMHNGVNIYYIWYGDWSQDSTANAILTDFANNIGGSPYFNINTTYGDSTGNVPNTPTSIKYVTSTSDSGSLGTSLNDGSIWTLVSNAISSGKLPLDANGTYFVLTAPFVAETSGFLTQYCGWHTYNYYNTTPVKYAFVGNPAAGMSACAAQSTGPNGDAKADAMVSVIAHELEEQASDPLLNAWYDSAGNENADKCAWTFGTMYTANGARANMLLGTRNYLIQQNWVNAGGGYCALSYNSTPDFGISVAPSSQSVLPGGTTGTYTITVTPTNGYSGTVSYSIISGLPAGATPNFTNNTFTITTTSGVAPGSYTFTVKGTDGTLAHTTTATLVVNTPPQPSFTLTVSPSTVRVQRPGTGKFTVTVTPSGGFSGTVNLTAGPVLNGVTYSFSPTSITASGTSTLTATVTTAAKKGSRSITVTGTSGSIVKTASAALQLQ